MVLRRFVQSLKEQNWTAIWIEFVLLVAGVFLGIQVANWNEARRERIGEMNGLLLLLQEVEQNVAYADFVIGNAEKVQSDMLAALAMLKGRAPGAGNANDGLARMAVFRDSTPISATYDDLLSTGKLSIIQSSKLRIKISLYASLIKYQDRLRAGYISRAPDILAMSSPYTTYQYDPEYELGYVLTVDWPAAQKDKTLVNAAIRVMGDQAAFHKRRFVFKQHVQELCDALAAEVGRKCNPHMD